MTNQALADSDDEEEKVEEANGVRVISGDGEEQNPETEDRQPREPAREIFHLMEGNYYKVKCTKAVPVFEDPEAERRWHDEQVRLLLEKKVMVLFSFIIG